MATWLLAGNEEALDALNERLLQTLNDGGRVNLTQNRLRRPLR